MKFETTSKETKDGPRDRLVEKLRGSLDHPERYEKLLSTVARGRAGRLVGLRAFGVDPERMKQETRQVKLNSLGDSHLVERFAERVRANGGKVFFAKDGHEATRYVVDVAKQTGARLVAKSKSLTTEEIDLNHALESEGIKCVETDLGELIMQLGHEKPVHLVYPAANKSIEDVASLFSRELNKNVPPEASAILKEVREHLRRTFLTADMGVTGANVGIAQTGTLIIETNEGNARLVTSLPKVHVCVVGMEKIVDSWSDAAPLVQAHPLSATGQAATVYISAVSQRQPMGGRTEGRELHVVILDNGRTSMLADPGFSDALNCIRCGACSNVCPTYGVAGGDVFGYIYTGPIGIPWTANVHGLENAEFAHLCIACGLCKEVCPVDIDVPLMIARVKQMDIKARGQLKSSRTFSSSEGMAEIASATSPVSNWVMKGSIGRYLLEKISGVDRRRSLPRFSRKRLRDLLRRDREAGMRTTKGDVVYFPDLHADYVDPGLGLRAVDLLVKLGYWVEVPELRWSGMPLISYGELEKARAVADQNLATLASFLNEGFQVVSTEPTAIYMLREIYPSLAGDKEIADLAAARSIPFFELVRKDLGELEIEASLPTGDKVGFHIPCHDRTMTSGGPAMEFLAKAGYSVQVVETGTCCGMGGTFGMKQGPLGYDLSMAVGRPLFQLFEQSGCKTIATESSVCSTQLGDGTALPVMHPLHMVKH